MYLVVEGPDGLGKSALVKLIADAAKERDISLYPEGSGITVPEPSKHFGKFQNAIEWGFDFLNETHEGAKGKLAILDRFPVPSELVYGKPSRGSDDWLWPIRDLAFWPLHFVYVSLTPKAFLGSNAAKSFLARVLATDPYYKDLSWVWEIMYEKVLRKYEEWWKLNQSHALRLEWTPGANWNKDTANHILNWLEDSTEALNV